MFCEWPQLRRCCFCMPLRKGVLTYGCIRMLFTAFMIFEYVSPFVNGSNISIEWMVYGQNINLPTEFCLFIFILEPIFDGLLIYGAYKKVVSYLKGYLYYAMVMAVLVLIIQVLEGMDTYFYSFGEMVFLATTGLCLQIYLTTLVWSLIKELESSSHNSYENELNQIESGELKVGNNRVSNSNTNVVPIEV